MDATAVFYLCKWLLAEIVRLLHAVPTDGAAAVVEALIEGEVPWVWTLEEKERVQRTGLTWKDQTLVLLLTENGEVPEASLVEWLQHPSVHDYRIVLRPMHKARLLDYDEDARTVRMLPPGVARAEALVSPEAVG